MRISNLFRIAAATILLGSALLSCRAPKGATDAEKKPSRRKVLTGVNITAVKVTALPRYNASGEVWDPWAPFSTDPDLFLRLSQFGQPVYTSETREDCALDGQPEFFTGLPFKVTAYTEDMLVELFDEDGVSSDDNVGYFTVNLMDHQKKERVELVNAAGTLHIIMSVEWVYEER